MEMGRMSTHQPTQVQDHLPQVITMANPSHLARLKEGVTIWNRWRKQHPGIEPDLSGGEFPEINLNGADLHRTNLREAKLREAKLRKADLRGANLYTADLALADVRGADLRQANLTGALLLRANLSSADLRDATLNAANLNRANFTKADLRGAKLLSASLVRASLVQANLVGCSVYGVSAWNVDLNGAKQSDLIITPPDRGESPLEVDNLEVAQFMYLLLNNQRIRHVIDTVTSKVVLILGRFKPERKVVLDAIRDALRKRDYLPVLFDFERPTSKDLTGTIATLANMARFIIADLTDPSSVPHELASLVPSTVVPVQAIILTGQREYAMFPDLIRRYHWVLPPYHYRSRTVLISQMGEKIIAPAEAKAKELSGKQDRR